MMLAPGRALAALALILLLLAACGGAAPAAPGGAPAEGARLSVVATNSILGDLVANVGGDRIALTTLVGAGGDAHTFEPTPEDGKALVGASVVFENGLGFEPWLEELYAASGSTAARVAVSSGVETLIAAAEEEHGDEAHGEFDPHIWHDVANTIAMVEQIRAGLAAADPAGAATYAANAERYTAALGELDGFIQQQVSELAPERRRLVTSHDTFGYFAKRYGFTIVGTALGSVSTESGDPAAADVAALVEEIRAAGAPAIFAENVGSSRLMETIADEAGVVLAPPLYTDALGEPGTPGATYLELMRYNVATIVAALR